MPLLFLLPLVQQQAVLARLMIAKGVLPFLGKPEVIGKEVVLTSFL